jgi:protein-disulfide isomerase
MTMRSFLIALFGGLIAVGAVAAVQLTGPGRIASSEAATGPSAAGDKAAIGKIVREYILANPEVLVEAMQELERKQDSQRDSVAQKAIKQYQQELLHDADSPIAGNPDGDVTIVEFSDYQCPYCKRAHATVLSEVAADGKVRIVYKDLPILGEASRIAALAALASRAQGKHDTFHNALMDFKGPIDRAKILEIAASAGIDVPRLEQDMQDPKLKAIIDRNMTLATALGVRGTPAFVIGNQFVPGAIEADALRQLITDARKERS